MPPDTAAVETSVATPAPVGESAPTTSALIAQYAAASDKAEGTEAPSKDAPAPKADPKTKVDPKTVKVDPKSIKLETKSEPEPEPEGARDKARYHLQHGDVAKAIETAFGSLEGIAIPDDVREALARKLGVSSQKWEQLRKHEQSTKRALAAKEQEVQQLVHRTLKEFEPFHLGRQAYQAGDYETAFKHAFGEDLADFQRKVIAQRVGKNPEVEAVRAELERERLARQEFERRLEEQRTQADSQREVQQYVAQLSEQLASSEDPHVARYAQRPRFVQRVFEIQRENYDRATNTTLPVHLAAEKARDEILGLLNEWSPGDTPAKSVQAAATPEPSPRHRARNLSQSRAAEATSKPRELSTQDLISKYKQLIELGPR